MAGLLYRRPPALSLSCSLSLPLHLPLSSSLSHFIHPPSPFSHSPLPHSVSISFYYSTPSLSIILSLPYPFLLLSRPVSASPSLTFSHTHISLPLLTHRCLFCSLCVRMLSCQLTGCAKTFAARKLNINREFADVTPVLQQLTKSRLTRFVIYCTYKLVRNTETLIPPRHLKPVNYFFSPKRTSNLHSSRV